MGFFELTLLNALADSLLDSLHSVLFPQGALV